MSPDDIDSYGVRFTGALGFWEGDLQTGAVQWSEDIDHILGLHRQGAPPSLARLLDAIVPEERNDVAEALRTSIADHREHHHVEYRCLRPDGREVMVRNEWNVECDESGKPTLIRGVIQDITPRKHAKQALRRQTALLELLYAVATRANAADTLERALQTSMERICDFGGWPVGHVYLVSEQEPRDLVSTNVWYAADAPRFEALREAVRNTRVPAGVGMPGRVARQGLPFWSADLPRQSPLPTTEPALRAGLRAALDVPVLVGSETVAVLELFAFEEHAPDQMLTQAMAHVATQLGGIFERKRSADALRESEARLRQILESMPIGVFVMDAQGKPYFSNKYARSINLPEPGARGADGARASSPSGSSWQVSVGPHDEAYIAGTDQPYPPERHPLQRALANESSVVADIEIRPPGRRVPLEVWGSPVFDERGRVAYALSAFYDISERKKVERMKDEFVSVVSHELRTPLTSIQGAIGLLENGVLGPLSEDALEMARIARDGCGRLLRLVNELLDIQKLEFGTPTLHPQPLPLAPILAGAVAASRPYAATLGIRLELADSVPGAVVLADSDRLSQVVTNLLSNAIKYTADGERILVSATRAAAGTPGAPGTVRVAVEDCGPGVPDEFRASLFHKFSQADASDARQKAGTGLGLAICKEIVEKLGGTIDYEPVPEGGARFYFELPELLRD